MSPSNRKYVEQFLYQLVRRFMISSRATRVGLLTYAKRTYQLIGFTASYTIERIYKAISGIRKISGGRRLGFALSSAKKFLFNRKPQCGRRRILICLTAGASIDQVRRPAVALQGAGVEIFMVGVGRVNRGTLMQVATDRRHLFLVGLKRLYTILGTLRDRICFSPGEITLLLCLLNLKWHITALMLNTCELRSF